MSVAELVEALRETRGFRHKTDIADVVARSRAICRAARVISRRRWPSATTARPSPIGDGYLLFAIEGMVSDFVRDDAVVRGLQQRDGQRQRRLRDGRPADRRCRCVVERRHRRGRGGAGGHGGGIVGVWRADRRRA